MSVLSLPAEIQFNIFRRLDRPSQLALGLTSPRFLGAFAAYFYLDQFRNSPSQWTKLGLPDGVSWNDAEGKATVIRYLTLSGSGDITSPSVSESEDEDPEFDSFEVFEQEVRLLQKEAEETREEERVEEIISAWLLARFDVEDGCIVCADCGRYIIRKNPDKKVGAWVDNMLHRPHWLRRCGLCEAEVEG
ncbi:hypothetical protein BDV26DRAFT_292206 [Aspergillus bertholletiae]|uniref:F-box domain-containing protein n=1 Tax=Aspergillus bertholletiae TaxID=1226010 RepID=A0A5N7B9X3_9EURO|nr:hypothetical protein BDV26DRAFT_292206 [Aspergillus bertholletiae]